MGKLRIRLQRPIPGVDHLSIIDPEEFSLLQGRWDDTAEQLGVGLIKVPVRKTFLRLKSCWVQWASRNALIVKANASVLVPSSKQ